MPNEKGMTEDKKARLEAIRAANAAKKAAGDTVAAPFAPGAPAAAVAVATAPAVVEASPAPPAGKNMSEEQRAKLEAIRAANAAKRSVGAPAVAVAAPSTPAAAPAATMGAPARATPAPPAAPRRPAARPSVRVEPVVDDRIPRAILIRRMVLGAIFGIILCVLFATMTGHYFRGAITGAVLGALGGLLVLSWPPERTTGE